MFMTLAAASCIFICFILIAYLVSGGRFGGLFGRSITMQEQMVADSCVGKSLEECKMILSKTKLRYGFYTDPMGSGGDEGLDNADISLDVYLLTNGPIVSEVVWNGEKNLIGG